MYRIIYLKTSQLWGNESEQQKFAAKKLLIEIAASLSMLCQAAEKDDLERS